MLSPGFHLTTIEKVYHSNEYAPNFWLQADRGSLRRLNQRVRPQASGK